MDQQRNRQCDEDGSRNVDTKIDAESGSVMRTTEEKSKEEVVILSTEKPSNFSKTATISTVSDVHVVAGDTVNRYAIFNFFLSNEFYSLVFVSFFVFEFYFSTIEFLKSEFSCVLHSIMLG